MNPNNPSFGQQGFQPRGQMMVSQGQMMMSQGQMRQPDQGQFINPGQGQFIGHNPGQMMTRPHGFNVIGMRPAMVPPSYTQTVTPQHAGMPYSRRPAGAPPSYNHALNQSFQQRPRGTGQQMHRNTRKPEEQTQKEKYFQQQQAKLKQFRKSSSTPSLDPNKLVDSIFGGQPTKSRTNKPVEVVPQPATIETDDGFGAFLSGPDSVVTPGQTVSQSQVKDRTSLQTDRNSVAAQPVTMATPTPVTMATATPVPTEKKDLTKMMMDSCDLSAPQKAKPFHKPALKEINPVHVTASVHHTSNSARRWDRSEELSCLFIQEAVKDETSMPKKPAKHVSPTSKHPPKPPPWLIDDTLIPPLYKHVQEACTVDGQISTERLYPILVLGGLPKEVMGQLWSMCNKTSPGQLLVKELYQLLGLIALAQNNYQVETVDILRRCPQAPVPFLAPVGTPVPPPQQVQIMPQSPTSPNQYPGEIPLHNGSGVTSAGPFANQIQTQSMAQIPGQTIDQTTVLTSPSPAQLQQAGPNQPHSGPFGGQVTGFQATCMTSSVASSPATLPVTQLPPAVVSPGTVGVTTADDDDDDFADFQTASVGSQQAGIQGNPVKDTKGRAVRTVKDPSKLLSSGSSTNKHGGIGSISTQDLKQSTVENFFGSDDSSETTSPDDYFDGYKSADSKPSDSTSQFSTDQSEGEDFKNFENYLDEFQRKKDLQDKESPLHRPVSKFLAKDGTPPSPSKFFVHPTAPVKKLPIPVHIKQPTIPNAPTSDEFSDFADFQSAPVATNTENQSDPLKACASAIELIGDEDKYAALRSLDFSTPPEDQQTNLLGEPEPEDKPSTDSDGNWADFQTASTDSNEVAVGNDQCPPNASNKDINDEPVLQSVTSGKEDMDWAAFECANHNKGLSEYNSPAIIDSAPSIQACGNNPASGIAPGMNFGAEKTDEPCEWAEFHESADDFTDFQSSIKDSFHKTDEKNIQIISVNKDKLERNEILGLFKIREEPLHNIKSRDDDDAMIPSRPEISVSSTVNKMHGISDNPPKKESFSPTEKMKQKHFSEEDDFMKPPPLDDYADDDQDEFGTYSRGFDFDDIIKPKHPEKKNMYGIYGVNDTFVVEGHKKDINETKNITIEVTKDSDVDNDSDSVSSKDNDIIRGLGKVMAEDSQSLASLELVVNKSLQNVRDADGGDTQSVSSNDFGNFEALPESKSLDSLDLRREDGGENGSSLENSDRESKEDSPATEQDYVKTVFHIGVPSSGLPIIGDRYSAIMHDLPSSDKHAYEWQRCLDNCCHMIQDANNTFNSISSSSVCNEVIKSTQGSQYVQGVIEIYRVVCKITVTMKKSGIHSDKLKQHLKDIDLAWNNLTAFLVGGSVMPDEKSMQFSHGSLLDDDSSSQYRACGVCLLDVEINVPGTDTDNDNARLTYSGRQYHASCANFWINCVDSTLPALKLPELL